MSKVISIAIANKKGETMIEKKSVDAVTGKGLSKDRKFKDNNDKKTQLTLIQIENINFFNKLTNSSINPINFRRNIITEGVDLNALINKEFKVGNVRVVCHDLCRPCKYLQKLLGHENLIKEMMRRSGIRCEILSSGKILVGDIIKTYD